MRDCIDLSPPICFRLYQSFASDLTSTLGSLDRQKSGQKPPVGSGDFRPASVIQNWLIGKSQTIERVYEIRGDSK
jgi:hypothetical protein